MDGKVYAFKLVNRSEPMFISSVSTVQVSSDMMNEFSLPVDGKSVRAVYAIKDPKWKFFENGDPLWFEDLGYYKK
jgi:hypothetical protein